MAKITITTVLQSFYPATASGPAYSVNDQYGFGTQTATPINTDIANYGNTLFVAYSAAKANGAVCTLRFNIKVDQDAVDPTVPKEAYQVEMNDGQVTVGGDIRDFLLKYIGIGSALDAGIIDPYGQ